MVPSLKRSALTLILLAAFAATPLSVLAQSTARPEPGASIARRVRGERFDPASVFELTARRSLLLGQYGRKGPGLDVRLAAATATSLLPPAAPGSKLPMHVGANRPIPAADARVTRSPRLRWSPTDRGGWAAAFKVTSPGARAIRLALRAGDIPPGAEVRFFVPGDDELAFGPYGAKELRPDVRKGERRQARSEAVFWSPVLEGDSVGVEVYVTELRDRDRLALDLDAVSHLALSPLSGTVKSLGDIGSSDGCEIDVACENLPNYVDAVAKIIFSDGGGSYMCTGQLLNDSDPASSQPYFITANHCIDTQGAASSIDFFWFFQRASCGGAVPTSVVQTSGGAALLHTSSINTGTDVSLLLLNQAPPGGTYLSGWAAGHAGGAVVGIHHPAGDLKKASFGAIIGTEAWSRQNFGSHYSVEWIRGVTEPGSSGSGLWSGNELVGVLSGGLSYCSSPQAPDLYGRLDLSLPDLSQWLDGGTAPPPPPPPATMPEITPGQSESGAISRDTWTYFRLSTAGQPELTATLETFSGDADLFLRAGSSPTAQNYDCLSEKPETETDQCVVPATGGDVIIGVFGYRDSNFRLTISGGAAPVLPGQPVGSSPSGTVDTGNQTYRWSGASAADSYQLSVRRGGSVVASTSVSGAAACAGSDCSAQVGGELADGDYDWSVIAVNGAGQSPPSGALAFTVNRGGTGGGGDLGQPRPLSPSGRIETASPTYRFVGVPGAASYELRVSAGGRHEFSQSFPAALVCDGDRCAVDSPPAPALDSGVHQWSVRALGAAGAGAWSPTWRFVVDVPLARPRLLGPLGTVDTNDPDYVWEAVAHATEYELRVWGPDGQVHRRLYDASQICHAATCTVGSPPVDDLRRGRHTWWVRPRAGDNSGPRSHRGRFWVR